MSALLHLVSDVDELIANWERTPFVSKPPRDLDGIFSLETVEELLLSGALPLPCVRLFAEGAVVPVDGLGHLAERGGAKREKLADPTAILKELAAGATLLVEELQTYCQPLYNFTKQLSGESGYSTYCTAFLTPADVPGVNPHYDTTSVFLRQLDGSKLWRVAEPVMRWPAGGWSATVDARTPVVLEVELEAGQCLYIPRGFIHSGIATSRASMHLSIAMIPPTWATVLKHLADSALRDESFREALPFAFHARPAAELRGLLTDRMVALTDRLGELAQRGDPATVMTKATRRTQADRPAPGSLRSAMMGRETTG